MGWHCPKHGSVDTGLPGEGDNYHCPRIGCDAILKYVRDGDRPRRGPRSEQAKYKVAPTIIQTKPSATSDYKASVAQGRAIMASVTAREQRMSRGLPALSSKTKAALNDLTPAIEKAMGGKVDAIMVSQPASFESHPSNGSESPMTKKPYKKRASKYGPEYRARVIALAKKGLSQSEIGKMMKPPISQAQVSNIERSSGFKRRPTGGPRKKIETRTEIPMTMPDGSEVTTSGRTVEPKPKYDSTEDARKTRIEMARMETRTEIEMTDPSGAKVTTNGRTVENARESKARMVDDDLKGETNAIREIVDILVRLNATTQARKRIIVFVGSVLGLNDV